MRSVGLRKSKNNNAFRILLTSSLSMTSAFSRTTFTTVGTRRSTAAFRSNARSLLATATMPSTSNDCKDDGESSSVYNPFLDQAGTPKFRELEPKFLSPAVTSLLEDMSRDFTLLEEKLAHTADGTTKTSEISYDAVLPEVEKIQSSVEYAWGVAGHLKGVNDSEELREVYQKCQPQVVKSFTAFSQSKPLYDALVSIQSQWENSSDDEQVDVMMVDDFQEQQKRRAVDNSIRSMKLGGVALEGEAKERFNEIRLRLAELMTKFMNNVQDATKDFTLTIDDAELMRDVPASPKAMWAQAHEDRLTKEMIDSNDKTEAAKIDPDVGPWRITLDGPSYINAMQFISDRPTREAIYRAFTTRASEHNGEDKNNVPLIKEILSLKDESSKLLGYPNFAERSLAAKMAPSIEAVRDLAELIAEKALPAAYSELEEITDYAREKGGEDYAKLDKLMPWDIAFWSERYREDKFAVTKEELRPYFALPNVLNGLFGLAGRLFGVSIRPADGEVDVWHEDVRYFHVYDATSDEKIASFFLDPYSRPSNKRGGAWMSVCLGKSANLKRDIPVAYLNCNGSPPVGDVPSLMTYAEVRTLFHEFGHGMQHMLTKADVGSVSGIRGVEWDAVELPSQFMENFLYDKKTIYGFAKHYETGEPLPEEIFDKLLKQKTFSAGLMLMRQLYLGQMDMELHSSFDPENESIFDVQRRMAEKYQPHNLPLEGDRFLCAFTHIFAGGYSAGYYSYKWAEVMSADAFGAFEEAGLDNEDEVQNIGKKFRETVLSLGGAVEASEVFRMFRGRDPSPNALLRHNGLL
mmetsp:Transcript_17757/g.27624  ORF Transcript_17757/g.27624 Transcript_17757/m.27624 type:complete len:804 (-) Transcript_17757:314-2725(-)|eukprot:CAMPEP_0196818734 /NCGR_PEP_ID=MMETSP1362-20130617/67180_1 /TAXON_ID=163516 /ORGANISM="Leptocylindrus danicus, Strain CCMP1856" /LENGTH=803 /DNA_ID=CAMNT_0042196953 /DNA_START=52 /DNA_END=2463 /DNA_ORIENTATION=+